MVWIALLYMVARLEVLWALLTRPIRPKDHCADALSSELIPSIAAGDRNHRDLAEIDQDGFLFAADERDRAFFNNRALMVPRRHHRIQIVFREGVVCIKKGWLPKRLDGFRGRLLDFLRFDFYLEAAALLRLRGLQFVPAIRRINCSEATIVMDYIWGRDLRHILAGGADPIDYEEISQAFFRLIGDAQSSVSRQVLQLVFSIGQCGVVQRDISAANFIRGYHSQELYMVDFSLVYLRPVPGWRAHARQLSRLLACQARVVTT
jgi:tRNA A-37 threonylcarbamoyl transferase component Bud32